MPYRLGGGNGHIDCIQLVYVALDHMDIPTPDFDVSWYDKPRINHLRDLLRWGKSCSWSGLRWGCLVV